MKQLQQFDIIPFTNRTLTNLLNNYKSPNDKISRLIAADEIVQLKKGLYVAGKEHRSVEIAKEILANNIYGPSYVSMESALMYYGLIPEFVSNIISITTKRSKTFNTSFGSFVFFKADYDYYKNGISSAKVHEKYSFLIAAPEKAICDKIIYTKNLNIKSEKAMREFLLNDLRMDIDMLQNPEFKVIEQCITTGRKKKELELLLKVLKKIS